MFSYKTWNFDFEFSIFFKLEYNNFFYSKFDNFWYILWILTKLNSNQLRSSYTWYFFRCLKIYTNQSVWKTNEKIHGSKNINFKPLSQFWPKYVINQPWSEQHLQRKFQFDSLKFARVIMFRLTGILKKKKT